MGVLGPAGAKPCEAAGRAFKASRKAAPARRRAFRDYRPLSAVRFGAEIELKVGGRLGARDDGGVREDRNLVHVARAGDEGDRVPGNARVLRRVETRGAVECVNVLDVEREAQAGGVRPRQVLHAQVVEVVVGIVEAEDREIFRRLEDAGEGQAALARIVHGGRRSAAGEALYVHVPAWVENAEEFDTHGLPTC